jgi:hypothetical protein
LLIHDQVNDFGALVAPNHSRQYELTSNTTTLLFGQEYILRSWYHQHLRLLNDAELLAFTVILKANPRVISSFVRRLIQSNTSLGLPLVSTDIGPDDSLLLPMQYHGAGYLEGSSSWQHISISDDIRESGGSFLAGYGARKPSQDSSVIPISAEIPGASQSREQIEFR